MSQGFKQISLEGQGMNGFLSGDFQLGHPSCEFIREQLQRHGKEIVHHRQEKRVKQYPGLLLAPLRP